MSPTIPSLRLRSGLSARLVLLISLLLASAWVSPTLAVLEEVVRAEFLAEEVPGVLEYLRDSEAGGSVATVNLEGTCGTADEIVDPPTLVLRSTCSDWGREVKFNTWNRWSANSYRADGPGQLANLGMQIRAIAPSHADCQGQSDPDQDFYVAYQYRNVFCDPGGTIEPECQSSIEVLEALTMDNVEVDFSSDPTPNRFVTTRAVLPSQMQGVKDVDVTLLQANSCTGSSDGHRVFLRSASIVGDREHRDTSQEQFDVACPKGIRLPYNDGQQGVYRSTFTFGMDEGVWETDAWHALGTQQEGDAFHGPFGTIADTGYFPLLGKSESMTLIDLPWLHADLSIVFDVLLFRPETWTGNAPPTLFEVSVDDKLVFQTSFAIGNFTTMCYRAGDVDTSGYPCGGDEVPGLTVPEPDRLHVVDDMYSSPTSYQLYRVPHIALRPVHTAGSVTIKFHGDGMFALDNVAVCAGTFPVMLYSIFTVSLVLVTATVCFGCRTAPGRRLRDTIRRSGGKALIKARQSVYGIKAQRQRRRRKASGAQGGKGGRDRSPEKGGGRVRDPSPEKTGVGLFSAAGIGDTAFSSALTLSPPSDAPPGRRRDGSDADVRKRVAGAAAATSAAAVLEASKKVPPEQKKEAQDRLVQFLERQKFAFLGILAEVSDSLEYDNLAATLVEVLMARKKYERSRTGLLKWTVLREIKSAGSASDLFRSNSLQTKLLIAYVKYTGKDYAVAMLRGVMRAAVAVDPATIEVDPSLMEKGKSIDANRRVLQGIVESFVTAIAESTKHLPAAMREVFVILRTDVSRKYPSAWLKSVVDLFVLRFLSPAIIAPRSSGLLDSEPSQKRFRVLVLVSKLLTGIATPGEVAKKEVYLDPLRPWMTQQEAKLRPFFETLTSTAGSIVTAGGGGGGGGGASSPATPRRTASGGRQRKASGKPSGKEKSGKNNKGKDSGKDIVVLTGAERAVSLAHLLAVVDEFAEEIVMLADQYKVGSSGEETMREITAILDRAGAIPEKRKRMVSQIMNRRSIIDFLPAS